MDLRILGSPPTTQDLADALLVAADVLDEHVCYAYDGRFHFTLEESYSIAISSDSADRVRVEICLRSVPRDCMWVLAHRHDRLASVVSKMMTQVAALV